MSGLQRNDDQLNVREQGNALRVATNNPHLVSLGTGRLSTAVTLHPIKQGRVTIGCDPTCDIHVRGTGVTNVHCRVENSHGVVTLYPLSGSTLVDGVGVDKPIRLSQGSMLTIGRSSYLRFNHPEEAELMKSVLPTQMAHDDGAGYPKNYSKYKDESLNQLNDELNLTIKEFRQRPPVPKKPTFTETDSPKPNFTVPESPKPSFTVTESPKHNSFKAKISKFEYYAKQNKNRNSQFYTNEEISPKVFTSNSLTVNTPAKDVLGTKLVPSTHKNNYEKTDSKAYVNVAIRNKTKIDEIVRNFDETFANKLPKKVNNDVQESVYGKINNGDRRLDFKAQNIRPCLPSPAFDRNPQYTKVYGVSHERNVGAESKRMQAYQERIKEQEVKEAENARLEEILNMCAEYERQASTGTPVTPTEKRSHNKIITNGSLPRSVALRNPNFVQTSEGYYKFETNHSKNNIMSQSLPARNVSTYENYDVPTSNPDGRMDEIGIPIFQEKLSSPIMIKKVIEQSTPVGSPYENMVYKYPKSPKQSPRSRIKTTFAKTLPTPPQYFVFPTPPPTDKTFEVGFKINPHDEFKTVCEGIEKQLSLEEEIPMIDADISDNIESRIAVTDNPKSPVSPALTDISHKSNVSPVSANFNQIFNDASPDLNHKSKFSSDSDISPKSPISPGLNDKHFSPDVSQKSNVNQYDLDSNPNVGINGIEKQELSPKSFADVKKELMADIPELEEFENDLRETRKIKTNVKMDEEVTSLDGMTLDEGVSELRKKYEVLRADRRKVLQVIQELKNKMSDIRSQEDDILRELEMEKALIKGEYDSEIAILNIEQKKRSQLAEKIRNIENEIHMLKKKQEARQNEMRDRVEIATLKVERLEKDMTSNTASLEELQNAQDILDNETKIYEDLEFQHLEEESELLSNREDVQNEYALLIKKIESQKTRILTLKTEANSNLTSALQETKILQAEYVRLLNEVEKLTSQVQCIEKELKPIVVKLNEIDSPQSSDEDVNYITRAEVLNEKFNSVDQMSQSMYVDIERRDIIELDDSPSKGSGKEKKGFWERNFDSLKRKKKKCTENVMSQSLNENMMFNDNIEIELERNGLRSSKNKKNTSKIPTLAALGKIIKKDSFGKSKKDAENKTRYVKNGKSAPENAKYGKSKSTEKILDNTEKEPSGNTQELVGNSSVSSGNCKFLNRKSCGDEPSREFSKISDCGKIPSQDDIDRISKVTLDAPLVSSEADMNSLGKKTFDSLMEIEKKRMEMLEEQGCQVIENEREKISELKKRVQNETKKMWDQKNKAEHTRSFDSDTYTDGGVNQSFSQFEESTLDSTMFESTTIMSSIEEFQPRDSHAESTEDEKVSDDSRPLSHASDFSRDMLSLSGAPKRSRRGIAPYSESQRPLTRYLPIDSDDFDLRRHVVSAGHQVDLCPHVCLSTTSCRGYLHKLGAKFHTWSKRWFVFDRDTKTFVYYWDKSERKPRGGAYFQVISEVYLDHANTSKSPNPRTTFIVQTRQRRFYLMAASGEAARIWIDVIFTGAQGYTDYME